MTTFAEMKTQAAALLSDPDAKTFTAADLGYFINAGIAQVSRVAPQRFREDVELVENVLSYPVRGGNGNLVANGSFEEGDETMFDGSYNEVSPGDEELTGGWSPSDSGLRVLYSRSVNAKSGQYIGTLRPAAAQADHYLYQDIPVNPGVTYFVQGWHWKSVAGGSPNLVRFHTLDSSSVVVTTDAVSHTTQAATPQFFSGSISIPDDGTVAYIRVVLYADTGGTNAAGEVFAFEDISVSEENTNLVAQNMLDTIEITRVEVWSSDLEPPQKVGIIARARGDSESGYEYWDSRLHIPYRWLYRLSTANHFLRVSGYAPYDKLTTDTQVTDLSFELEQAVMEYVLLMGLQRLSSDRSVFTQWQTRSGNTDITPAGLMSALAQARDQWRRTKRDIFVLREST